MRFLMPSKPNRRSTWSAGHFRSMLMGSALVACGRFDRRVDADVIASGLRGDLARIPPHLPIPLQFARPAGRARLPPALGALLDIDRRVAIEDVRHPIA